tara:strand:+ start:467 stop:709 length:243 start_codon:yes stop_codon:yes gene_type:complete
MELKYDSDEDIINTKPNFVRMEWELNDHLEQIFEDVIVPYLNDCMSQEILKDLNDFNYHKFMSFFKDKSSYYNYIMENIE